MGIRLKSGALTMEDIQEDLLSMSEHTGIGAYNLFIGQVRPDRKGDNQVAGIQFSCYQSMVDSVFQTLLQEAQTNFPLIDLRVGHSLGWVSVGQFCFYVIVAGGHRVQIYQATEYIVNRFKSEVPIFGKEIFEDASYQWKVNR